MVIQNRLLTSTRELADIARILNRSINTILKVVFALQQWTIALILRDDFAKTNLKISNFSMNSMF